MDSVLNVDTAPTNHQPAGRGGGGGKEGEGARGVKQLVLHVVHSWRHTDVSLQLELTFYQGGGAGRTGHHLSHHTQLHRESGVGGAGPWSGRDRVREW